MIFFKRLVQNVGHFKLTYINKRWSYTNLYAIIPITNISYTNYMSTIYENNLPSTLKQNLNTEKHVQPEYTIPLTSKAQE